MINPCVHINATSGKVEYFTPLVIIEAARKTMGSITLDPASSQIANKRVMAEGFFGPMDGSLAVPWHGNIFMNHPFGKPEKACAPDCGKPPPHEHHAIDYHGNAAWINKLIAEYRGGAGPLVQACCITYACTSEVWFRPLLAFPQCFLYGRTNYVLPNGTTLKGNTKGSVVTYLGFNAKLFAWTFSLLGAVHIPWGKPLHY